MAEPVPFEQLLNMIAPAPGYDPMLATQFGVSRTSLGQLTNPELSIGAGVVDPGVLQRGIESYLAAQQEAALQDYFSKYADLISSQPTFSYREPSLRSPALSRLSSDPYSDLLQPMIAAITNRTVSADQAANWMTTNRSLDDWAQVYAPVFKERNPAYNDVQALAAARDWANETGLNGQSVGSILGDRWTVVERDFKDLERDVSDYTDSVYNYQQNYAGEKMKYDQEMSGYLEKLRNLGSAQDYVTRNSGWEQAKLDFYKEMGVPGLALAPDPGEQYSFDRGDIRSIIGEDTGVDDLLSRFSSGIQKRRQALAGMQGASPEDALKAQRRLETWEKAAGRTSDIVSGSLGILQQRAQQQGRSPFQDWQRSMLEYAVREAQ